jgi:hypothetical protein
MRTFSFLYLTITVPMAAFSAEPSFISPQQPGASPAVSRGSLLPAGISSPAWKRHTIDDSSKGADGVRLADVNGDGLPDIVTGWEEGGVVRVCFHPGKNNVRERWPAVTVGKVNDPEDAVAVDLDGDGALDVVSSCEGTTRTIFVHWGARNRATDPAAWRTEPFPATAGLTQWMFCAPARIDGLGGVDLFVGSKGRNGQIAWLQSPENPRNLAAWKLHPLRQAGWVMSLVATDMNGNGRTDLLFSDRKGETRGVFWLEHPGAGAALTQPWPVHPISRESSEDWMFLTQADMDGDGLLDIVATAKPRQVIIYRRLDASGLRWNSIPLTTPDWAGRVKAVTAGDLDGDGRPDLVVSFEGATEGRPGVIWMSRETDSLSGPWTAHNLSGPAGSKFDLVELIDLDGDGDLDVIACEEAENLGLFWYENPLK